MHLRWPHYISINELCAHKNIQTLKEECALCVFGSTHKIYKTEISSVEHHLALQGVERVVWYVSEGRRQATNCKFLRKSHGTGAAKR